MDAYENREIGVVIKLTNSLNSNTDPVEGYPQKVTNVFLKYQ